MHCYNIEGATGNSKGLVFVVVAGKPHWCQNVV